MARGSAGTMRGRPPPNSCKANSLLARLCGKKKLLAARRRDAEARTPSLSPSSFHLFRPLPTVMASSCLRVFAPSSSRSLSIVNNARTWAKRGLHTRRELPYPTEGGVGKFLPPSALKTLVEYQDGLLARLDEELQSRLSTFIAPTRRVVSIQMLMRVNLTVCCL